MEHNVLCEQLFETQKKVEILELEVAFRQYRLLNVKIRAKEAKKEHLNSMEDVKHYNQTLIDMNEQYWKDLEAFAKVTQLASNNMQLACVLGAS